MKHLKQQPQWVNWKLEPQKGKIPKNPKTGGNAQSNNPSTWASYELAEKRRPQFDGIGFMFNNGVCGIDIDKCDSDPERKQAAEDMIQLMDSYTEYSPSGNGYHIIFRCDLEKIPKEKGKLNPIYYQKNPHNGIECYFSGLTNRFFTYTGNAVNNQNIEDRTEQVLQFLDKYMKKQEPKQTTKKQTKIQNPPQNGNSIEDAKANTNTIDVISIAKKAKNGNKFLSLFEFGDRSQYNGDDSTADIALCNILAFYCRGDHAEVDRLFRQSALMREKWEREDYRNATISKAIALCGGEFYKPKGRPKKQQQAEFITIDRLTQHLEEKGIKLRYNVINRIADISGLDPKYSVEHYADILPTILYDELKFVYDRCPKGDIQDYLSVISSTNRYNPVLDILHSITWDKQDRLPEIFHILGIKDTDRLSKTLLYKWMWQCLSMARNELESAYGADGLLCLTGNQGIGKTSFFRTLAVRQEFFYEGKHIDFKDKDTTRRAGSAWITELGEVESTLRSDVEKLKAFITDSKDMYRLPYGRTDVNLARRTSLCATCNSKEFLIDPTGNRRFWSIPVENIDLNALTKLNVLQLWAQVDELTKHNRQGFRLTRQEQTELAIRNGSHEKPLKSEMEIRDILDMAERRIDLAYKKVTVSEFKMTHDVLRNYSVQQIAQALNKIGIEDLGREYIDGERKRVRLLPVWKGGEYGNTSTDTTDSNHSFIKVVK